MSTLEPTALEPGNFFIRLLLVAVYALIMFVIKFVLQGVVLIQLLCHLFGGGASPRAQKVGQVVSEYIYRMWLYMTYNTNEKPFPFGSRKR
ncbi:DUF4389 domain-containing protein [Methylomagnum sp.]